MPQLLGPNDHQPCPSPACLRWHGIDPPSPARTARKQVT